MRLARESSVTAVLRDFAGGTGEETCVISGQTERNVCVLAWLVSVFTLPS